MNDIYVADFLREMKGSLSKFGNMHPFDKNLIVGIKHNFYLDMFSNISHDLKRTAIEVNDLLNKGTWSDTESVVKHFFRSYLRVPSALNSGMKAKSKCETLNIEDTDETIRFAMHYYNSIYENLMPLILSPVIFSHSLVHDLPAKEKSKRIPDDDARVSLDTLSEVEGQKREEDKLLSVGLENHLRNSIAHQRYRIQDGLKVEMWDVNSKGKRSWGPEIRSLANIRNCADQLFCNAHGIVLGMVVFSINNNKIAFERGWLEGIEDSIILRIEELEDSLASQMPIFGFTLIDYRVEKDVLHIGLYLKTKGIDQNTQIFMGGDGWTRGLIQPVRYNEHKAIEQIHALLYGFKRHFLRYECLLITVTRYDHESNDKQDIWRMELNKASLSSLSREYQRTFYYIQPLQSEIDIDNYPTWVEERQQLIDLGAARTNKNEAESSE